jgi:exonuclease SbcC
VRSWNRRKNLVDDCGQIAQKLERLEQAKTSIDDEIKRVRKFRDVANQVKKDVIEEVFNESLNRLWGQLLGRLVKSEPFRLSLSELTIVARKMKVNFEATSDSNQFGQPGAVLSSGNLNTAALSLFLTLNLIEQTRHDVLVLDDPVQNMDDMHVVHLAEVLKSVARETGRQVILAVHERPLLEYLSLELAPTHSTHSLITLELERDSESFLSTIKPTCHKWRADNLAFG